MLIPTDIIRTIEVTRVTKKHIVTKITFTAWFGNKHSKSVWVKQNIELNLNANEGTTIMTADECPLFFRDFSDVVSGIELKKAKFGKLSNTQCLLIQIEKQSITPTMVLTKLKSLKSELSYDDFTTSYDNIMDKLNHNAEFNNCYYAKEALSIIVTENF